jgi:hypothetical protein
MDLRVLEWNFNFPERKLEGRLWQGKSSTRCRIREAHNERSLWLHEWIGEVIAWHGAVQRLDSKQTATTLGSVGQFEIAPDKSASSAGSKEIPQYHSMNSLIA